MYSKFELIGAAISVGFMALAIYLTQVHTTLFKPVSQVQTAQVIEAERVGVIVVDNTDDVQTARARAYREAIDSNGNFNSMVIDDIKIGTGEAVKEGDLVAVHYIGTLQDGGAEFDNSHKRGTPFEFEVGAGMVIKGWDEGLVGMKVGGQRVLVIPPDMAYGEQGIGPIPPNATLVFAIELIEIK